MVGLLLCSTGAWASVIPIIQDGKLIGADNVKLGPLGLYKFRLARGSCRDIFANNCDPALFTFTNAQDATLAAQALLDQVFVGYYDDVPSATFGCSGNFGCQPYTPYRIDAVPYQWGYTDSSGSYAGTGYTRYVKAEMTSNWAKYFYFENFTPTGYPDEVLLTSGPEISYGGYLDHKPLFAVWERQDAPVPVPEPSSFGMMSLGFSMIALVTRRQRHGAAKKPRR